MMMKLATLVRIAFLREFIVLIKPLSNIISHNLYSPFDMKFLFLLFIHHYSKPIAIKPKTAVSVTVCSAIKTKHCNIFPRFFYLILNL